MLDSIVGDSGNTTVDNFLTCRKLKSKRPVDRDHEENGRIWRTSTVVAVWMMNLKPKCTSIIYKTLPSGRGVWSLEANKF